MRMIVTAETAKVYGKSLRVGDEFECPDKESRLWSALARAVPASGGEMGSAGELPLVGEKASDATEAQGRRARQGRYSRRDLRAED